MASGLMKGIIPYNDKVFAVEFPGRMQPPRLLVLDGTRVVVGWTLAHDAQKYIATSVDMVADDPWIIATEVVQA